MLQCCGVGSNFLKNAWRSQNFFVIFATSERDEISKILQRIHWQHLLTIISSLQKLIDFIDRFIRFKHIYNI